MGFLKLKQSWLLLSAMAFIAVTSWLHGEPDNAEVNRRVAALIEQLGDESYERRETANRDLEAIGDPALAQLRVAIQQNPDPETRYRAALVVRKVWLASRSTGLPLVHIPAGEFVMGSPAAENGRTADETQHKVRLNAFLLGKYEVTQREFEQVMGRNSAYFAPGGEGKAKVVDFEARMLRELPVENVSWYDALEFCNRLSALDNRPPYYALTEIERRDGSISSARVAILGDRGYRLPTEAEWEYACRAETTTSFSFGLTNTGAEANVKPSMVGGGYGGPVPKFRDLAQTTARGSYPLNPWGIGEMHGNVAEWCWDVYAKDYYSVSPAANPQGPEKGPQRVVRGGSWLVPEENCRSASRFWLTPDDRKPHVGFRVARSE